MSVYRERILPRLLHLAMRQARFAPYRERLLSRADGLVLDVGSGSGVNLPLYRHDTRVVGLEPSRPLLLVARRLAPRPPHVLLVQGSAECVPLPDAAVDTVIVSWTLCSIPQAAEALREMRRVLRPDGRLLFVEHGRSPDETIARWQDRLTPIWKRLAGGCHLNRRVDQLVETAGFRIERLETGYMPGPRLMTYTYEGEARP